MNITGRDIAVQEAHRNELRRQAQAWNILRRDPKQAAGLRRAYMELMVRLGGWLEAAGCRLKSRYTLLQGAATRSSTAGSGAQNC
jgi:hypothetical protein